jgi:adenylate cyclase
MTAGEWTFAFVDLAGFTALTEAHGDETAADHAGKFYDMTRSSLNGSSRLVKQIGDAVLIAADVPEEAVLTVTFLMATVHREVNFPLARAGIHTGSAVRSRRHSADDYLGSGVNVAARATAQASGRQILLTETVVKSLDQSRWSLRQLGHSHFRNVPEPIEMFQLIVCDDQDGEIDPVCRMRVPPGSVVASLRHGEHEYAFCSLECVGAFATNPDRYVRPEGEFGDD